MELAIAKPYTWQDYLQLSDDDRYELINGDFYAMSPAPTRQHQDISFDFSGQLWPQLRNHPCSAYAAPFDVRLPGKKENAESSTTILQPDISIICDQDKLDDHGCVGPPDFVAEIISPSTAVHDNITKTTIYELAGVREYWIIHPIDKLIIVRILDEAGVFIPPKFIEGKGSLALTVLPELIIDLDLLFGNDNKE